jgi:uncharacterized membrane protein YfcA
MFALLGIGLLAFFSEYMDAALGMGYGTTLTPLLLILGFEPLEVVPAVLLSQFVASLTAGFFHHRFGNVDFRRGSLHLNIALGLAFSGIVGSIAAVFIAINIPQLVLEVYIGLMVLAIGIVMLVNMHKNYGFSWKKITGVGLIASFNKGISGGGYGPVVTGGQILSGLDGKNAVGITSLAEGLTCVVSFSLYFITESVGSWELVPYVLIGAIISVPFSAATVRRLNTRTLRIAIAILTIVLGAATLFKVGVA